ncbi:MAG: hypothetical protein WB870_15575 [Gallionellaceae bacterium]
MSSVIIQNLPLEFVQAANAEEKRTGSRISVGSISGETTRCISWPRPVEGFWLTASGCPFDLQTLL